MHPKATQDELESMPESAMQTDWRLWCRLCAKADSDGNINVFCKNELNVMDNTLATAIGKYFWVNIRVDDGISHFICTECHKLITSLVSFTERVNKVQAMFCLLQNTKVADPVDPNEVQMQYGLLDEEWEHIIKIKRRNSDEEEQDVKIYNKDNEDFDEFEDLPDEEEEEEEINQPTDDAEDELEIEEELHELEEEIIDFEFADEDKTQLRRVNKRKPSIVYANEDGEEEFYNHKADVVKPDGKLLEMKTLKKEHDVADDEDDLEDSDLYNELKGNDIDYEIEEDDNSEQESEHESIAVDRLTDKKKSLTKQINEANEESGVKRKRGRPPKNPDDPVYLAAKKIKDESDESTPPNYYKYACSLCERRYRNPTSYRKHMKESHNTEPDIPDFVCEKCSKVFPTERQLANHERNHLPLMEKLDVPCPFCDRLFTKIAVMRQHVSGVHNNEKPFICDQCGRALKTRAALNEHKLVHTEVTPYECDVCHKSFKNKARLKVHTDTHTETNYVCSECGMVLNTRRTLKMHMLVHSDAKKYKCDFCTAEFKRSKALKNHLILHTGLRPYKCNYCDKTFSNGSNCRSHKKKAHPKEVAIEDAQGKEKEKTSVPKLNELRTRFNVVDQPRKIARTGGLPPRMRALIIAAEEREKRTQEQAATQISESMSDTQIETHTSEIEGETVEEEDDEETVIYEIIQEM